jgi:hypothetical protein
MNGYKLTSHDLMRLQECGVSEEVCSRLRPLAKGTTFPDREKFEAAMDPLLAGIPFYPDRFMILKHAKQVQSMNQERGWPWRRFCQLGVWLLLCVLVLAVAIRCVDVNLFSLHAVYGNRLVRCYLGASRPDAPGGVRCTAPTRRPDPVTEFDPDDDLHLAQLRIEDDTTVYDGPFLLINTALNLVRGDRLDWQERKAESFLLTPLFCGSADTGYRLTATGDVQSSRGYGGNIWLGNAVTLSGAAASPNMGYHSSAAVTALLTVFNARLGAWLGNPASSTQWVSAGPTWGFAYLFKELFGWTQAKEGYVYLSDGGHFENLGAYELIRRRCQFIIVSDAGQDREHRFQDLGNLIRKCRVDFGIDIEMDLGALSRNDEGHCRWHCAVGRIRYDNVDAGASPGTLIYLKPSLTGDEPADVLHFARCHPAFPHDSTVNQFYNESLFENYRALGRHVATTVFKEAVAEVDEELARDDTAEDATHGQRCRALFDAVARSWFAMPPEYETTFVHSADGFIAVQEALRKDEHLWRLTLDLYPDLDPGQRLRKDARAETATQISARERAELHAVAQMLQVMENAWLSLNLDVHYAHPLNRGWMDVFHRWTNAATFRAYWPLLRSEFARGFVSFCEKQMRLDRAVAQVIPLVAGEFFPPGLTPLCAELQEQWPERWPWVEERIESARADKGSAGWLIYPHSSHAGPAAAPDQNAMPCGIILIAAVDAEPEVHELFVWMRGAYRNTGLGRCAVDKALKDFRPADGTAVRLRVRLPVALLTGPGGELQKNMWLTFFYHLEFVRVSSRQQQAQASGMEPRETDTQETEIVLERELVIREPSSATGAEADVGSEATARSSVVKVTGSSTNIHTP